MTSSSEKENVDYYNRRWAAENSAEHPPDAYRTQLVSNAAYQLARGRSLDVVDVGCGNGWILAELNRLGIPSNHLFGIEPSKSGVQNTLKRVPGASAIEGLAGSVYLDRQFDVVVCSEVIEHVEGKEHFMTSLANLVKPGGHLVLTTPNGFYREEFFSIKGTDPQPIEAWITRKQLRQLASKHFLDIRVSSFSPHYWYRSTAYKRAFFGFFHKLKGGWTVTEAVVSPLVCYFSCGLYLFIVARKRPI